MVELVDLSECLAVLILEYVYKYNLPVVYNIT